MVVPSRVAQPGFAGTVSTLFSFWHIVAPLAALGCQLCE